MGNWRPGQKEAVLAQAQARGMIEAAPMPTATILAAGAKMVAQGAIKPKRKAAHTPGVMNDAEAEWAIRLAKRKCDGEIEEWAFEPFAVRLADKTSYTPDFISIPRGAGVTIDDLRRLSTQSGMDAAMDPVCVAIIERMKRLRTLRGLAIIDEIKGSRIWEKNRIKFKIAADKNPWGVWNLWQKTKENGWSQLL